METVKYVFNFSFSFVDFQAHQEIVIIFILWQPFIYSGNLNTCTQTYHFLLLDSITEILYYCLPLINTNRRTLRFLFRFMKLDLLTHTYLWCTQNVWNSFDTEHTVVQPLYICTGNLFWPHVSTWDMIWAKSSNVQSVISRQLRKVTSLFIINSYIRARSSNVQSLIIRQPGEIS